MLKVKIINHQKTWESFLLSSTNPSFLQSYHWGQFHQSLGHQIFRLGFFELKKLVGIALIIKINSKRATYFECPGGPVIDFNQANISYFIKEIKKLGRQHNALFIRIRPNSLKQSNSLTLLKNNHFIKSPMHLHAETTWILNLTKSLDTILKEMRKNTRHEIKKAQKLGVKIITSTDPKDIDLLFKLQLETIKRKHFIPFSKDYLNKQLLVFKKDHQIKIFKAIYQKQVLAISFIIFYGSEAIYHYSGSSNKMRHIPASYALQWAAIKEAKKRGLKQYNFWGYTDNPHHRFYGPSLFKKGFGGEKIEYLPAHDLPLSPLYWLVFIFETFRRKFRHL